MGKNPVRRSHQKKMGKTTIQSDRSPYGMFIFRGEKMVFANQRAEDILGFRDVEEGGFYVSDFLASVYPEDREQLSKILTSDSAIEPGQIVPEIRLLRSDGAIFLGDLCFNSINYWGEAAVQILIIDISKRRMLAVMRDIVTALASSADLYQALEIILISLRNWIHYDRAGLFLMDENQRFVLADNTAAGADRIHEISLRENAIVKEFFDNRRPVIVPDIQPDPRFTEWPQMSAVRGWLGAPLLAGDNLIGFISLGSLKPETYNQSDASILEAFTDQLSEVLDKTWIYGKPYRKTGDLEVLRNFTFALGQADNKENIISAIIVQITHFFGAAKSSCLLPDHAESKLTLKYAPNEAFLGIQHAKGNDLLWKVFHSGESVVILDIEDFLQEYKANIYQVLLGGMQTGVLIPIKYIDKNLGILCFAFENRRKFSSEDIKLLNTISEIAGNFFYRAIRLEELEEKIDLRTQHLSALYNIQAVASETLELEVVFTEVLRLTIGTLGCRSGCIHLFDNSDGEFRLAAIKNIPGEIIKGIDDFLLNSKHRQELESTKEPVFIDDFVIRLDIPPNVKESFANQFGVYVAAPIKVKDQLSAILSLFWEKRLDQFREEVTLIATIAQQLGNFIERTRLIHKAEQAAVVEERQRLARELHDSVTQLLYSQILFAGAGKKVLKGGDLSLTATHLSRIEAAAQQAMKEMRLLVYELRPSEYLEGGLVGALQRRLDAVENRTNIRARMSIEGELNLDEMKELALYYIAQEALNNTLKHAGAEEVKILIYSDPERVTLEVIDDGCGFDLEESALGGGMGISNMSERAAAIGGKLQIFTSQKGGTRVVAMIEEGL